jgi:hypothetical protein
MYGYFATNRNPPVPQASLPRLSLCIRQSGSESYKKTIEIRKVFASAAPT